MEQIFDIQPPSTSELEEIVLCDIISNPDCIVEIRKILTRTMFSIESNAKIWDVICSKFDEHEHIDIVTIHSAVDAKYFTARIISHIDNGAYGESEILARAESLREEYIKRCAFFNSIRIMKAIEDGKNAQEILAINKELQDEITQQLHDNSTQSIVDVINEVAKEMEKGINTHITTGIKGLDFFTYSGFSAGSLVLLAARPSVGKTSLALQMAMSSAMSGKKSVIFSLEMTAKELAQRLLVGTGEISTYKMATREIEWMEFDKAARKVCTNNLLINDKSHSLEDICMKINVLCQEKRCDIAFIDYLGLINLNIASKMSIVQQIGEITRRLKLVAKNCNIPIVLLCQLNRASAAEKRSPQLYDLRDSGSLEQDADIVLMLERPNEEERAKLDMWIRKNRGGRAGEIAIHLQGDDNYTNFVEI